MSVLRWSYRDTNDLVSVHVPTSDNAASQDLTQVEYRFMTSTSAEQKWHRPAEDGQILTGRATFPDPGSIMDVSKLSQIKFYLNFPPGRALELGVTHIEVRMIASRKIDNIKLRHNFLLQNPDDVPYPHNQDLKWEIVDEFIDLDTKEKTFSRKISHDHIKRMAEYHRFQTFSKGFYYWRMEGAGVWRPNDWIEFDFKFYCQP